ncbi:hypothetical protein [Streptomyces sp. P9-A2]|uniref:hypothetical protein n=1 Tax=Streptomyces sp. P9-A2 TaxID=3072284 RepID=UPI002FCACFD5
MTARPGAAASRRREQAGFRTWGEVHGIEVADVTVGRTARRHVFIAFDVVSTMPGQDSEQSFFFAALVTTGDGTAGTSPFAAITGGPYRPTE